jgi:hypothetical protein
LTPVATLLDLERKRESKRAKWTCVHLKHSEYVRQSVRVCEIYTCGQTATNLGSPFAPAGGWIESLGAGCLPLQTAERASDCLITGNAGPSLLAPRLRARIAPKARQGRVDREGSALLHRLAAGTRDLRYHYSLPNSVCYSHLRTRVPPNGSRATAPARPNLEASRLLRCTLRRRPATPLVTRPSPHRPRRVLCAF